MPPPPRARMQSVADSRHCVCEGRSAVGSPGEAAAGLTLSGRRWGKPPGIPLLAACPSPARRGCSCHLSHPACLPPLSPPAVAQLSWREVPSPRPGKEPDSFRLGPGRCRREQSHPVALHPWKKVGGRRQSGQVAVLVGDAVHGSEVMSGSLVISSSVPQAAACPRVPRSGGNSYGPSR